MRRQDKAGAAPFGVAGTGDKWPISPPFPNAGGVHATAPEPVETLAEQAYARLRYALITGQVIPGQRTRLGALAHQLRTSMTPVRDAMSRLAAADALRHSREAGVVVPVLNSAELDELLRLRLVLERVAFTNAITLRCHANGRSFKRLQAELSRVAESNDAVRFAAFVWALRVTFLGLSRSSLLSMFVDRIWCRLGPTFTQWAADSDFRHQLAVLLGEIVSAIDEGDPERAHAAVTAEITAGMNWQPCSADREIPVLLPAPDLAASSSKPQDHT